MIKVWSSKLIMLCCALTLATPTVLSAESRKDSALQEQQDDSVRVVLMNLESSMSSKNIENVVALFAQDTHVIDQAGEEFRGINALKERLTRLKESSVPAIGIHPQSISFPAKTVALVVGEVSRKRGAEDLPASRFSMLMVKNNKSWQIAELQETTMQAAQKASCLQELSWLIGEWSAETPDSKVQLNFEWSPDKKFIKSKCILSKEGKTPQEDTQVIGWDPQRNVIVSWQFDANGGFGSGTWSEQVAEKKWTVKVIGVGADGSNSSASNVFFQKSPDEFVWQSLQRTLDGEAIADTAAVTVHRVKR